MICRYLPLPSCRMGALWALSDIENACILEFGPAGTTHFAIEGISNLNGQPKAHAHTTHIREHDLTFGDTKRLEAAIIELDQVKKPAYIFILASTLTAIIGVDLESTCDLIQNQVKAKLIALKSDGFQGDYTYGIQEVLTLLAKHLVQLPKQKKSMHYNLIGATMDLYQGRSDVKAIQQLLSHLYGATCHVTFTCDSTIELLEQAGEGVLNIAMRIEAIEACEVLEKRFQQPYVTALPYGIQGLKAFMNQLEEKTGWHANPVATKTMMMTMGMLTRRMQGHYEKTPPKVMVSGNADMVNHMVPLLTSFNIAHVMGLITHPLNKKRHSQIERAHNIIEGYDESQKISALDAFKPDVILGDQVLMALAKSDVKGHMMANPNLDYTLLHHEVPLMGLSGMQYLCQTLLNIS